MTRHEGKAPLVSIVMPAYNVETTVRGAITALLAQQSPRPREIIVVDDGSTDRTSELISSFRGVRVLHQPNGGPALARNAGAAAAHGDVLAFIDSDCEAAPTWLDLIVGPLEDPEVSAVKGAYRTQRALPAAFVQPGVDPRELEAIFRPFIRGSASASHDGLGVGLALAKQIAEAHGGTIVARNHGSSGAIFELRVRLSEIA